MMTSKGHTPEQIINKPRQAKVEIANIGGCLILPFRLLHLTRQNVNAPLADGAVVYSLANLVLARRRDLMRRATVLSIVVLIFCHVSCTGQVSPNNVTATRATQNPPAIDGDLTDTCWQEHNSTRLTHFVTPEMARLADPQTEALVCFDTDNLYIAVRCDEPKPDKLRMEQTERDGRIWQDDCVELFLDTNRDRRTFYQIVINAKGVVHDRGPEAGVDWDADLKVAANIGAKSWQIECAIPFADLDTVAQSGDTWGFNVGRERKVQEELSLWSATGGDFRQPERFGDLVFTDLSAAPAVEMAHHPMFGLNEMTLMGPESASPEVRFLRSWPGGDSPPWDYPAPELAPANADAPHVVAYRAQYRIVDGSEQAVVAAQSIDDQTIFRQSVPFHIRPEPRMPELIADRLPALERYARRDTEFGSQIRQLVGETRQRIEQIVQTNLTRDDRMPQEQWQAASKQLAQAINLPYIVWTKWPWADVDRHEMPPSLDTEPQIAMEACVGEYDSAAFILTNPSASTVEGRLNMEDLQLNQGDNESGPTFSHDRIEFREAVYHKLRSGEIVADPLPEMGQGKILAVPSGESRQVWLTLHTEGLPPGEYTTTITFLPFDPELPKTEIPVSIRVRPVRLLDQMPILTYHWDYFSRDFSEYYVQNFAEHYVNCFSMKTRHVFPEYDQRGNIVEKYDWSNQDRILHTKLKYARRTGGLIVYSYGVAYDFNRYSNRYGWEFMSEPYKRAFAAHLREFERHLREDIGMSHDEYVVQIWDEAHHRNQGEKAVRAAEFIQEIVPEMQTCMDGGPPIEELPEVNPLVDIWIPHMAHLWKDGPQPQVQAWKDTGKPVCGYTTSHPKKALDPHGHFRLQPWKVWQLGLDGDFYWGVYSYGTDIWNDFDGKGDDNVVVYPSPEGPVTSRRWEATREGREDYIYLHMLREAAARAGDETQQRVDSAISELVDKVVLTADDPQEFEQLRAELGKMLEAEVAADTPALTMGPEFAATDGSIHCSWETDRPTSGRLMYRVPGFKQWSHVEVEQRTEHSAIIDDVPAHRPIEWYLIYWAENGAAAANVDGLNSENWFRPAGG